MSLQLPEAFEVLRILEMSIGDKAPLQESSKEMDLAKPERGTYYSLLLDKEGEALGAILASLNTTVFLGGNMIMIPTGGQEDQARYGEASEPVTDAMGEINNMLRGLLNRFQTNEHVAPNELSLYEAPAESDPNAWLLAPSDRLDMIGKFPYGEGMLTIVAR